MSECVCVCGMVWYGMVCVRLCVCAYYYPHLHCFSCNAVVATTTPTGLPSTGRLQTRQPTASRLAAA